MRILHVSHAMPPDGRTGVENYTATLAGLQAAAGHEVRVFTRGTRTDVAEGFTEETDLDGYRVIRDHLGPGHHRTHQRIRPGVAARFAALLDEFRPDIVSIQHLIYHCLSYPERARAAGAKVVATLHDHWLTCPTVQRLDFDGSICVREPGAICRACVWDGRRARALSPGTVRSLAWLPLPSAFSGWLDESLWCLESVDLALSPSRYLTKRLATLGVVPNRLAQVRFGPLRPVAPPPAPLLDGPLRLGLIGAGRLKGVEVARDTLRRLEALPVRLEHFGDDPGATAPNVTAHGRYTLDQLDTVFGSFDVLLVPSIWPENAPMVIPEAFARRRPVVASNVGGIAEMVRPGHDGLLVRPDDPEALAAAIRRLLDEPALRTRLTEGIRPPRLADDHAAELEALYASLRES